MFEVFVCFLGSDVDQMLCFLFLCRRFMNVPVLVNNLGLLEQLAYWKVSAPCSAAGYNLTMKKHGYGPALSEDQVHVTPAPPLTSPPSFCRFSSRFFSSNGLLRDVGEVNKMNESLQSELQVSGGRTRRRVASCRCSHSPSVSCVWQKACGEVEESERLVEALQAEVSALRRRLKEKKQSGAGKGRKLWWYWAFQDATGPTPAELKPFIDPSSTK